MKYIKINNKIIFIFLLLIFDLIISNLFLKNTTFWKVSEWENKYWRIQSEIYHHDILPNINVV